MRILTTLFLFSLIAASSPLAAPSPFWVGESNLADPESLLDTMRRKGASELPLEAITLYRAGLESAKAGDHAQAEQHFQDAIRLYPTFPEAHFALARVQFPRQQSWESLWAGLQAVWKSFGTQHMLLVNLTLSALALVLIGSLIVVLFTMAQLGARVHHVLYELLCQWLPKPLAVIAAGLLLVSPFFWGVGLIPVFLLVAGLLWQWMARSQRQWVGILAGATLAVPVLLWLLSPLLFYPLDPEGRPFLLSRSMASPHSDGMMTALVNAQNQDPKNANLHFAQGMLLKRAGRWSEARHHYEEALRHSGPEAPIRNNLGVIAFHRGDYDLAVSMFKEAVAADRKMAAPHFNLSLAYAKKLYFDKADEELREANRLAFSRIREIIKLQDGSANGSLLDEPLPASRYWKEAWSGPRALPRVPTNLSRLFPGSLLLLPILSLPLFALGWVVGRRLHRSLASFACTNCGNPVCRRCLRRIKRAPYCMSCGDALLQIQSAAFSRMVLDSRLRRTNRVGVWLSTAVGWILPGYHALRLGRTHIGALLCMMLALSTAALFAGMFPISRLSLTAGGPGPWWPEIPLFLMVMTNVLSWITVWKLSPPGDELTLDAEDLYDDPLAPLERAA